MQKLTSIGKIKSITNHYDFRVKKKFGQNFLICDDILNEIILGAELDKEDIVVEIGPGIGILTQELAENAKEVLSIEIDKTVIPILEDIMKEYENFHLINEDVLKIDLDNAVKNECCNEENNKYKIVANLPYYITTPIIMKLLESKYNISDIIIMVQKEVAERITASPGTKQYGALSLAVQYYTEPNIVTYVSSNCFWPAPEVDSAVLKLHLLEKPSVDVLDEKTFFKVVKSAFAQRRKTLLNTLASNLDLDKETIKNILEESSIDPKRRGETLSIVEFSIIADKIYELRTCLKKYN